MIILIKSMLQIQQFENDKNPFDEIMKYDLYHWGLMIILSFTY